jgi:dephospho-CoA kinase
MSGALRVGLTGGIASGKSAALDRFAELGAVTVDSDVLAREAIAPGTQGFSDVVNRFGAGIVRADGQIDRSQLASIVFGDAVARADLEAIVHPWVRAEVRRRFAEAPDGAVVVNAVPLLVEAGLVGDYDHVVVVEAPLELQVRRLAASRGMGRMQALARIAAQASVEERRAVAWRIIVNGGDLDDLRRQVDEVWRALQAEGRGIT